jgi:hypothetical protein
MPSISRKHYRTDDEDSSDENHREFSVDPPPSRRRGVKSRKGRASTEIEWDEENEQGGGEAVDDEENGEDRENEEVEGEEEDEDEEDGEDVDAPDFADNYLPPVDDDELDAEEDILGENYDVIDEEIPFQPGAIVRITLTNFVTYTFAEISPGPSLNMIIGPNGTGKSTLVCAICLGLGYPTNVLGRAKDVGSFVKRGTEEAIIEIELQGKEGERNPVISRKITRAGNATVYYLHGRITPGLNRRSKWADLSPLQAR